MDTLSCGFGKADITAFVPRTALLGYGLHTQRAQGVRQPLFARAFVVADPQTGDRLAYCVSELCFITQAVREAVIERLQEQPELGFGAHNVMLTATHTHSAPGGISHYMFYNFMAPGVVQPVLRVVVDGIVAALVQAARGLAPGRVRMARGDVPPSDRVAFNRAIRAYNLNPDVLDKATSDTRHLAVNREMTVLRFEDLDGGPRAAFSWFGTHGCSLHGDNRFIHPDNLGCAAAALEGEANRQSGRDDFVAGFAQVTCGDVTPNFRWSRSRRVMIGVYDDDFESARYVGGLLAKHAGRLLESAEQEAPLEGPLRGAIRYADHGSVRVDADLADGMEGSRTAGAVIGLGMLMGTWEGPGPLRHFSGLNRALGDAALTVRRLRWRLGRSSAPHPDADSQLNKFPFLDTARGGHGKAFGFFTQGKPLLPGWLDPTVARVRELAKRDGVGGAPWTPQVLPIQLLVLGPLALAGVPGELTTTAGRRLGATVRSELADLGVEHVVTASYANAYSGYVTTREEYRVQGYEGASTVFGQWTLAAYQTRFRALARALRDRAPQLGDPTGESPYRFTDKELALRAHDWSADPPTSP